MHETHQQLVVELHEHFGATQNILLPQKVALMQQFLSYNYGDNFSRHFEDPITYYMVVL